MRVVPRESVIRRDRSKGGSPSTRHTTTANMPAQRQSSSSGSSSLLSGFRQRYNPFGREFRRRSAFVPYPLQEDILICTNGSTADDESWEELGLYDFVMTNQRIGRNRFNHHSGSMLQSQQGLFNRGLEPWDVDEEYSNILETSMAYTASMGMMLYEQNEFLRERVSVLFELVRTLLLTSCLVGHVVDGYGEGA